MLHWNATQRALLAVTVIFFLWLMAAWAMNVPEGMI